MCVDGSLLPFLLHDFVEGKISTKEIIDSNDFELALIDDSMSNDEDEGSNEEDGEESQSSLHIHGSYNLNVGGQIKLRLMLFI